MADDVIEKFFSGHPVGRAMTTAEAEALGSDKPQNGDQRLNNVGLLEVYYGGHWNVKEL
jgi:hypothetical protein